MKIINKRKKALAAAGAAVIAGALLFFGGFTRQDKSEEKETVNTAAAKAGVVSVTVESIAVAEPYSERNFRAPFSGLLLEVAGEGAELKQGDIIAVFETEELDRQVSLAEIALSEALLKKEKAEADLAKARKTLSDREVLFASGAVSREQLELAAEGVSSAEYELKSVSLAVERSKITLNTAEKNRRDAYIKAPFNGTVLQSMFTPGDWVSQNSVILSFGDISRLRFKGEVDEYDVGRISPGMPVAIKADSIGNTVLHAEIETVSPQAQIISNIAVFTVRAAAENPDLLMKPGMSADLSILLAREEGIIVPSRAVTTVRTRSYVDVLTEEGPETRRVNREADDGINTVVSGGIEDGELVIIPANTGTLPGLVSSVPESSSSGGSSIIPMPVPGGGGGSSGGGGR